ncbi:MAG: hypothetical protein H7A45_17680 [Verrucomicrobiales bacterium]|nr:hypothetical protein [Verrucomicrobiales bacterium]MCP5525387.1 hypothetical protein [Verrucomicrobiales bacterium]
MTAERRASRRVRVTGWSAGCLVAVGMLAAPSGPTPVFPDHEALASGVWAPRMLPGQGRPVFTLYGTPGDPAVLRELIGVMRERGLGNGFDPGPAARAASKPLFECIAEAGWPVVAYPGCADMQINGGRCVLGPEDAAALAPLADAGIFHAIQLGEWGYYFHNLAPNEGWWRAVYGDKFETFKHLMKPAGLKGYEQAPATRRECYELVQDYYRSRCRDLLGRVISVTGHSHYEAYAAEWGTRCVGLELGENIAFTQSKLAFARGAARQWGLPWSVQVSPWFAGACTTAGPLRGAPGAVRGLDAGHSLSLYERLWLHAWFAGAAMVTPENSIAIFFEEAASPWTLTSHGAKAAEVFRFMQDHSPGVPYTPVAIVLDQFAGYNGYMGRPWGILEPTPGDREIQDLFDHQLFPGSDHIHARPDPANPEASYLRPTPYGEMFDVLLSTASGRVLAAYPVVVLAGDHAFAPAFRDAMDAALRQGTRVLLSERHQAVLGEALLKWQALGAVEVLAPWTHPAAGRSAAIAGSRLRSLAEALLPLRISGDPVGYQINRLPDGWVVELINNRGVVKKPDEPAAVDPTAVARVVLEPRFPATSAREWRSGRRHAGKGPWTVEIGPGASEFVEIGAADAGLVGRSD